MDSDSHFPEEAPTHQVKVDGFWIDRTPVTNRQFLRFVKATGYVTFAGVKPDPKDYLGTGKLVEALRSVPERGWLVVDMAQDWNRVFAFSQ